MATEGQYDAGQRANFDDSLPNSPCLELNSRVLELVECTMDVKVEAASEQDKDVAPSTGLRKRSRRKLYQPRRLDNSKCKSEPIQRENNNQLENAAEISPTNGEQIVDHSVISTHRRTSCRYNSDVEEDAQDGDRFGEDSGDAMESDDAEIPISNRKVKQGEKQPCHVCGRLLAPRYMTNHMRTHAPKISKRTPRKARTCSNIVQQLADVVREGGTSDEEITPSKRRQKLYECYICDKSFSKRDMPSHMRTHAKKPKISPGHSSKKTGEEDEEGDVEKTDSSLEEANDDREATDKLSANNVEADYEQNSKKRKLKKFPCDICGKSFDRNYMLEHMCSHARKMSLALAKTSKKIRKKRKKSKEAVSGESDAKDSDAEEMHAEYGEDSGDENSSQSEEDEEEEEEEEDENENEESKQDKGVKPKGRRQRQKFPCKVCGAMFNKYYMVVHVRSHTGEKPFTCHVCEKQFVSANSLNAHKQNCHGEMRGKIECDICGRLVSSKSSLKQHVRTHSDERPFQCHVCGKAFKQCAQLSAHVKTHLDGMPYQCEHCGHRYKSITGLIRHRQYHHLGIRKKYPCEICDKVFTRHSKLRDHIMWHKGTSPYICKYCDKRLLSRKTLNTHLLIHEDRKPYECEVCGKAFRQNCVLKRHLSVHTGIKPFRCEQCGKQFIHRVYLVKHTCEVQDGTRTFIAL